MDKTFWQNKKTLITGHTGSQGTWLSTWLSLLGAQVLGFSLEPSQIVNERNANKPYWQVSSQWGNIRDSKQVTNVIQKFKPDIIFHIAHLSMGKKQHQDPHQVWTTNVQGTINVLEAIRQFDGKLSAIFVAPATCYGEPQGPNKVLYETCSLYGECLSSISQAAAQLAVEAWNQTYFERGGLITANSARYGEAIGGFDTEVGSLIPDLFWSEPGTKLLVKNPITVKPWIHNLDCLYGYILLAQSAYEGKARSKAYNFGPKPEFSHITTNVLLAQFLRQIDVKVFQANFPDEPDFRSLVIDSSKAKMDLGWEPQIAHIVDLADWTTEWYTHAKYEPWKITEKQIANYEKNING